jgi:hypothetical protein
MSKKQRALAFSAFIASMGELTSLHLLMDAFLSLA